MTTSEPGSPARRRRRRGRDLTVKKGNDEDVTAAASPKPSAPRGPANSRESSTGRYVAAAESGNAREAPAGRDPDRNWRELAGNAPSQVGVGGAMRARDVSRPSEADLAAAEREITLVRRQWRPPDDSKPVRTS